VFVLGVWVDYVGGVVTLDLSAAIVRQTQDVNWFLSWRSIFDTGLVVLRSF